MPFERSPPELIARFDELAILAPEATKKQAQAYARSLPANKPRVPKAKR